MTGPLLDVRDLQVDLSTPRGRARVLNGVSLAVAAGEPAALVGESGCGKTLTARAILGLLPRPARVAGGAIRFRGRDLLSGGPGAWDGVRGSAVTMVFQDPMTHLNPTFTIGEQLVDVALLHGRPRAGWLELLRRARDRRARVEARALAVQWLRRVQIPDPEAALDRYPFELSGGQRQRVLIAMALLPRPSLVIADEPGTALDVSVQDQVLELLEQLVREEGTALLFITHNLGVARRIARRVYVMYAGEVAEHGPADRVFREPLHPYTRGLVASVPRLTGVMGEGIAGRIPDFVDPPPGCRFAPRCPFRTPRCDEVRPALREVEPGRVVACHLYDGEGAA